MVAKRKGHRLSISKRSWGSLSPALQETRKRSLSALSKMRQGLSLTAAAREVGIDRRTVLVHLGRAIVKPAGKYVARPTDDISRSMVINTQGRQTVIAVRGSKTASTIGQYHNAVRQYLNTGEMSTLKAFENVTVVDSAGVRHRLETNIKKIRAIESAKEEPEFFEIYRS